MQTRKHSLAEAITNTAVGFALSWGLLWLIAEAFGWHQNVTNVTLTTIAFTFLSLVRSYAIRRLFNWFGARQSKNYDEKYFGAEALTHMKPLPEAKLHVITPLGWRNPQPTDEEQRRFLRATFDGFE